MENSANNETQDSSAEEDLELFKLALRECPSIDNNTYFRVHFIKDRDVIQKIYDNLWKDTVGDDVTQTQILANLLVLSQARKRIKKFRRKFTCYEQR